VLDTSDEVEGRWNVRRRYGEVRKGKEVKRQTEEM
jgi:hypothetical protein